MNYVDARLYFRLRQAKAPFYGQANKSTCGWFPSAPLAGHSIISDNYHSEIQYLISKGEDRRYLDIVRSAEPGLRIPEPVT